MLCVYVTYGFFKIAVNNLDYMIREKLIGKCKKMWSKPTLR
jgi:hypothetical protein